MLPDHFRVKAHDVQEPIIHRITHHRDSALTSTLSALCAVCCRWPICNQNMQNMQIESEYCLLLLRADIMGTATRRPSYSNGS